VTDIDQEQMAPPKPRPTGAPRPKPRPTTPKPRLGELVRDAEGLLAQARNVLKSDYDPASAPSDHDVLGGPGYVHSRLMCAAADISSALKMLGEVTDAHLPPAGSAVPAPCTCPICRPRVSG
jgi:hypothetical protein